MTQERLAAYAKEYLAARLVIAGVIKELRPTFTDETAGSYAECIIARLASHDPPLLIGSDDVELLKQAIASLPQSYQDDVTDFMGSHQTKDG